MFAEVLCGRGGRGERHRHHGEVPAPQLRVQGDRYI